MPLLFEPISDLSKQQEYLTHLARCAPPSDYTFMNLWGWSDEHDLSWAFEADLVWIRQEGASPCYWAPIGPWEEIDWADRFSRQIVPGSKFIRVPEKLAEIWKSALGEKIQVTEARGHWDYVYDLRDLVSLAGNRFHKKKNLLVQFKKSYRYSLVPFGPEFAKDVMALQGEWCLWRECETISALASENRVIRKVFANWEAVEGVMGAGIIVDSKLIAYTVAEPMGDRMVVIHFEKANTDYKGAYQAINQLFLESIQDRFDRVNREQDLDDDGLRKAKLSYQPSEFLKKYGITYLP